MHRAGLTMVPNVPWHRAPRRKGAPEPPRKFLNLFNCHLYRELFDLPLFRADHQLHRNVVLQKSRGQLEVKMCLLYALSPWCGYVSIDNVGRLNKILRKAKRYGFTDSLLTFSELWEQSDEHWRRSLLGRALGRAGSCPPTFCSQWTSHDVCPTTFCPTEI